MAGLADAATDRVSIAQAPALTAWSVCAWVKLAANASFSPIVRVEAGGGTAMVFGFKNLIPSLYSAASTTGINGTAQSLNTYVFVAATRNGTTATLYWGTNPAALSSVSGTVNSSGTPDTWTVFGRSPSDGSEWFSGTVDYLRTWGSTVLTAAEVAAEGASATAVKAGAWGNWPFGNNGSGGVSLNDTSGNARHLTAGSTLLTLVADVPLSTTINASGAATAQQGVGAGSGAVLVSGSATAAALPAVGAGAAATIVAGTGAAVVTPATAAGAAGVLVQGSGAAAAQLATAAGSVGALVLGSGAAAAAPAAAAGAASVLVTAAGTAVAQPGEDAATGSVLVTGSGAAVAPPATSSGSSGALPVVEGSGTAVSTPAAASGTSAVVVSGSGAAAAAPLATSAGAGSAVTGGTGTATSPSALAAGLVQVIVSASGTAVAPAAVSEGRPPESGSLLLQVGGSEPVRWLAAGAPEQADVVAAPGASAPASWLGSGSPVPA